MARRFLVLAGVLVHALLLPSIAAGGLAVAQLDRALLSKAGAGVVSDGALYNLSSNLLQASFIVSATGTCLVSLSFLLTLAGDASGWTPNLLVAGASGFCGGQVSATAVETQAEPGTLINPSGGEVAQSNSTYLLIGSITLGSVATEQWEISLNGPVLSWNVLRSYTSSGIALTDQVPAIWLQSTTAGYDRDETAATRHRANGAPEVQSYGPDWRSQVQIPSFLSVDEYLLDPDTQVGYAGLQGGLSMVLSDSSSGSAHRIMLGPAGVEMNLQTSACRFAMTRPAAVFTQQIAVGAECAVGPGSSGYAFAAGDLRSHMLTLSFAPAPQGHGYFDLSIPSNSSAAWIGPQTSIFAKIFTMPMGWINGNSPACETCIHEASIFSQLQGLFRLGSPPGAVARAHMRPAATGTPANNAAVALDADPASESNPSAWPGRSCTPYSNPFCAYNRSTNTVSVSIECDVSTGNSVISSINSAYGTPTVQFDPLATYPCISFTPNATCNDANFQAAVSAACMGQSSCSVVRQAGDFDPCPNVVKAIAITAQCSASASTGPAVVSPAVVHTSSSSEVGAGGRQVPQPGSCPTIFDATRMHMDFLLSQSVNAAGQVAPRWDLIDGNDWRPEFSGIIDQMPHMVLAAYYHALNTYDVNTTLKWMPTLDRIAGYMLDEMLVRNTSLLTNVNPLCDGRANISQADNWLDDVRFGWRDAIVGAYAVEAFRRLGDLKNWTGDDAGAAEYYGYHQQMVVAYNAQYWDDAQSMYHDWVDISGAARSYFYTWQNFVAIEFGIASTSQAQVIMATADKLYADIHQQYNVSEQQLWCTPTNLIPLSTADLTVDFDDEYVFPHYENGDCFMWHSGLEMMARGRVNGSAEAFNRYAAALTVFNATRLWGQRYSWLDSTPMGSDVITDALWLVYGGLQASLNIRTSLLDGLTVLGSAAAELEGANFTFALRGQDVTVGVRNGTATVITNSK